MNFILLVTIVVIVTIILIMIKKEYGLYFLVFAGVFQDVLRKLDDNQSIYFITISSMVLFINLIIFFLKNQRFQFDLLLNQNEFLKYIMLVFLFYVVLSGVLLYFNGSSIILPIIGLIIYILPIIVVWFIYEITENIDFIYKLLKCYLIINAIVAISIILDWQYTFGDNFILFIEVGEGVDVYDATLGEYIDIFGGFYRTPEIAAWHMGLSSAIAVTMAVNTGVIRKKYFYYLLSIVFLSIGFLCGRRKMFAIFLIFLCLYFSFLFIRRKMTKEPINFIMSVILISALLYIVFKYFLPTNLLDYISRAGTTIEESDSRGYLVLESLKHSISKSSLFGNGIGIHSQGSRFGNATSSYDWSAEFGFARVILELGLVGLSLVVLIIFSLTAMIIKIEQRHKLRFKDDSLNLSIIAILLSQMIGFAAASQVYSDLYILIILGILLGFSFAFVKFHKQIDENDKIMYIKTLLTIKAHRLILLDNKKSKTSE